MLQYGQAGSVLGSSCTQIPLLSPVTRIQFKNIFIDARGPNPITLHGMLMQLQGYMIFFWICILEVKAEPDFEDIPDSFLMATITLSESEITSLLMKAEVTH